MDDLRARFVAGDDEAIRAVIAQYGGAVQTIARSMMSEPDLISEVVQQTFIKAWKAAGSFDPDRELAPWLYSIARRTAIDILRRERRPTTGDHEEQTDDTMPAQAPDRLSFEKTWERYEVRRALDQLAPGEREVIRLSHFVGLPHPEIAEQLGVPIGTVKSRANRAMKRLAAALGHLDDSADSANQTGRGNVEGIENAP